jgi:diguanylate cyclase (GGDEF)-like protein/PAS domain S-box-containing protein
MMSHSKIYNRSFRQKLSLTFAGSALILLLAGGFALYLMSQLSAAVERAISDILPKTLVAMRLSEHSALLAASAPSLTNARNLRETHQIAASLDKLKKEIDSNVSILEEKSESHLLAQVRDNVAILADTLLKLKGATNHRIALDERHFRTLARIREVHGEFADTVSPVVWGVSSLTRLLGKRAARVNVVALKGLRDQHVQHLVVLMELQLAYRDLVKPGISSVHASYAPAWETFVEAWERTLMLLQTSGNTEDPVTRQLTEKGEKFRATWRRNQRSARSRRDPKYEEVLTRAVAGAQGALARRFSTVLKTAQSTIADFVEQSVKDMGYALDIKAEGNLSFALLTAVADTNSRESVSSLQDRFKRSRATFRISANEFLNSKLSLRNPILAGNVAGIERRLQVLGEGPENLFDIRREQLLVHSQIEQLLASNRSVAAQLKQQVEQLVEEVQDQAARLGVQLEKSRGANRALLVLVFLIGLILLLIIAFFSIRTLEKQDRDIRQAAMVFESTGEGVIITDPHARIVAVNQAFSQSSEYERDEIAGRHIRILRSKRHLKVFYEEVFETLSQTGRWQGEIYTRKKSGDSCLEWLTVNAVKDNKGNVSQYVAVFSDVAIVKRSLQQLDHLAHHDTLTGLPNRLLLQDRINHAIHRAHRERRQLAVLFIDLDRFKNINDTLGHTVGDRLLRISATRLSNQIREGDTVARLGGDEFIILLEDYRVSGDARSVAKKVMDSLGQVYNIKGQGLFITASIGISLYPKDGVTADELVSNSDAAMYRAKEKGKNNYQFYTSDLTVIARENLRLESSLRLALERDEFVLYYQPKWKTKTGEITGVEALLRWQHPERGLIGPAEFLTALEDYGLILPVGKWILQTACRQARAWREQGLPAIQMSINLSGQQIAEGGLLQTVTDSLAESRLDPRYLELELTEGFIMQQPDEVIILLNSLRAMGVSIAIDDFGTGHSSLSYLKQLPVKKLKIDRSFVRDIPADPDDMAITSAIVALGHRLKMSIVAEGVETEEQLAFLTEEGCEEAQGYLFSMPLPENELRPLLERGYYFAAQLVATANA